MDWGFVTDRLAVTFRKETWVGAHDRRFVGETLYGLVRHLRRVDLAIERARRTKKAPKDLERLLALLVLEGLVWPSVAAKREPRPRVGQHPRSMPTTRIAGERKLEKRIALAASLPDWLAKRFVADWGADAEALAHALNAARADDRAREPARGTRAVVADALAKELAAEGLTTRAGAWCDTALDRREPHEPVFATTPRSPSAERWRRRTRAASCSRMSPRRARGQGRSSSICARAPGGKTLAIAGRMQNKGRIVASDIDGKAKLEELRKRGRRARRDERVRPSSCRS